jgi:hypothetical protein
MPRPADPWATAGYTQPVAYGAGGELQSTLDLASPPPTALGPGQVSVGRAVVHPKPVKSRLRDDTERDFQPATRPDPLLLRPPVRTSVRQLRRGGEWTSIGVLFAFVCWGIWAISARGGDLSGPVLAFILVLIIAAGLFALARLIGRLLLERWLGRTRRSAWGAHLVTGLFLAASGVAYLGQTPWVVSAWTWLKSFFL